MVSDDEERARLIAEEYRAYKEMRRLRPRGAAYKAARALWIDLYCALNPKKEEAENDNR